MYDSVQGNEYMVYTDDDGWRQRANGSESRASLEAGADLLGVLVVIARDFLVEDPVALVDVGDISRILVSAFSRVLAALLGTASFK